jgi:two-component system phosphate regulon sensor histidine kinase PhoR
MRRKRRIFWRLLPWSVGIVVLAVAAASWHSSVTVYAVSCRETAAALADMARLVEHELGGIPLEDEKAVDALCKAMGEVGSARFTVVGPSGRVIGDSAEDPAVMDNHAARPEIRTALLGETGSSTRYSNTLRAELLYVALPLRAAGQTIGAVRAARPLTQVQGSLATVQRQIVVTGVCVALLAAAGSLIMARRLSRPIETLREGAERFARGELDHRLGEPDSAELGELARTLNLMAAQLATRIEAVTRQRNELETVLKSMAEGVVAVDRKERLITANRAAVALLGIPVDNLQGRPLLEVVRNPALQRLVAEALQQEQPVEGEIVLQGHHGERYLQVHGAALSNGSTPGTGVVIVLNDVTRLRRLEQVRRDFVANVSHELRTPITSLKGFVETLLDGALHEPENAERFLRIILAQADRLNAIISDLLLLAQMEQTEKEKGGRPEGIPTARLADVIQAAVRACQPKGERQATPISSICPETLKVGADARLLEQAVVNLLDNAINYSESGRPVEIVGREHEGEVLIEVRDQGCGIAAQHQTRIFERFYRVDKARSRAVGGTGLGLAIVKHIVQVHGGSVTVTSELGKGSVFTIHLPVPKQPNGRT